MLETRVEDRAVVIKILLVDDHTLFRRGIASLLASQSDTEVVGEASDGLEAVDRARELGPDVILMDIRMPGLNGIEAIRRIREEMPGVKVIALTVSDEDEDLFQAIKWGAQGYLLKSLTPEELLKAIRGVMRGEVAISPPLATKILEELSRQMSHRPGPRPHARLTPRERGILQLVAGGSSNKEISQALCISESTTRNHLHNILEKLHLHNRVQAAIYARNHGLISSDAIQEAG
jgi:DNA-binding NarL/FixJ family response regulator